MVTNDVILPICALWCHVCVASKCCCHALLRYAEWVARLWRVNVLFVSSLYWFRPLLSLVQGTLIPAAFHNGFHWTERQLTGTNPLRQCHSVTCLHWFLSRSDTVLSFITRTNICHIDGALSLPSYFEKWWRTSSVCLSPWSTHYTSVIFGCGGLPENSAINCSENLNLWRIKCSTETVWLW